MQDAQKGSEGEAAPTAEYQEPCMSMLHFPPYIDCIVSSMLAINTCYNTPATRKRGWQLNHPPTTRITIIITPAEP